MAECQKMRAEEEKRERKKNERKEKETSGPMDYLKKDLICTKVHTVNWFGLNFSL